jgi:hypothetical protein
MRSIALRLRRPNEVSCRCQSIHDGWQRNNAVMDNSGYRIVDIEIVLSLDMLSFARYQASGAHSNRGSAEEP